MAQPSGTAKSLLLGGHEALSLSLQAGQVAQKAAGVFFGQPKDYMPMANQDELVFKGSRFYVVRLHLRTHDGQPRMREVIRHPGSAVMVPLLDGDRVCLIRNHRPAVNQTLIELPAGTLEPGEDPRETADRELVEETGFRAGRLEQLHEFYPSPGILDEKMILFLATELTPGAPQREVGEEIENLIVPWPEAVNMINEHHIQDAKTIVGLLFVDRFRRGVRTSRE